MIEKKIKFSKNETEKIIQTLPEVIAVKHSIKKLAKLELPNVFFHTKINYLEKNNIFYKEHKLENQKYIIISKQKKLIEEFIQLDKKEKTETNPIITQKIGKLLDFPNCCTTNFSKKFLRSDKDDDYKIRELYKSKETKNYLSNLIFSYQIIPHFPCELNCKKTLNYAKKVLEAYKKENIKLYKFIKKGLNFPILYFTKSKSFFFDGVLKNNSIKYNKVLIESMIFEKICKIIDFKINNNILTGINKNSPFLKKLEAGNKIKIKNNLIFVYKDENLIFKIIPKIKPKIISFE